MLPDKIKDKCMLVNFKHNVDDKGYFVIPLEIANYIYVGALQLCKNLEIHDIKYQDQTYGKYAIFEGNYDDSNVNTITLIPLKAIYKLSKADKGVLDKLHIRSYNMAENPYNFSPEVLQKLDELQVSRVLK